MKKFDRVPAHLKGPARELWQRLRADYELDDAAGLALLRAACEAAQRAEEARQQIEKEGAVVADRFGQLKAHPATLIERDSRNQMISALRALRLRGRAALD